MRYSVSLSLPSFSSLGSVYWPYWYREDSGSR